MDQNIVQLRNYIYRKLLQLRWENWGVYVDLLEKEIQNIFNWE